MVCMASTVSPRYHFAGFLPYYELSNERPPMKPTEWLDLIIIVVIYAGIAIGQIPRLRMMNRATIALVGAAALIAVHAIDEKQAFAAIDLGTLMLLFAMMIINVNLRLA